MNNAVNWFEIYASNFKRAKKFYTEVFKCKLTDIPTNSDTHSQMEYAVFLMLKITKVQVVHWLRLMKPSQRWVAS